MSAMYFDAKIVPRLWKADEELDLAEMSRRFPAWTYLPILPERVATLRTCIGEGIAKDMWSAVYGDKATTTYRKLIETKAEFDSLTDVFDGATFVVRGELRDLIREELRPAEAAATGVTAPSGEPPGGEPASTPSVPAATAVTVGSAPAPHIEKRYARVRLRFPELPITKTTNLQPYLWKVLQNVDASSKLSLTADIACPAGLSEDTLAKQIVEAFEMLGIAVEWEPV
jgi:hypothetical protein